MDYETILVEKSDGVATITLNRPQTLNAWDRQMGLEVTDALEDIRGDMDTRVVIMTGAGRGFSSGADVAHLAQVAEHRSHLGNLTNREASIVSVALQMRRLEKPVIGAINGVTAGGGFGIALACDLRIASEKAQFSQVFVRRGLVPDVGSTFFLPKLIGVEKALELIFTGDLISAQEAVEIGLVSRVFPHDDLMPETMKLAKRLATGPPIAMGLAKRAVYQGLESNDLPSHLDLELSFNSLCFFTEDFREGVKSFLEKRPPEFKGE